MQTIIELPEFLREARRLMDDSAIDDLKIFLSSHPYSGDLLTGTGGVRKLRWRASADKGKSGGVRVIYFSTIKIHLFYCFRSIARAPKITCRKSN